MRKVFFVEFCRNSKFQNNISPLSQYPSSTKDMLMKRFNYHSERVLLTTVENEVPTVADLEGQVNEESTKVWFFFFFLREWGK